jgi:hypothetical protein
MRHAVRERVGLASAGARENEQRLRAVAGGCALRAIQFVEFVRDLHGDA